MIVKIIYIVALYRLSLFHILHGHSLVSALITAVMVRFTSLTAVLASLPLVFSHPSNTFVSRDERGACGTVLTPEAIAAFEELASLGGLPESSELAGFEAKPLRMAAAAAPLYPWGNVVVPTWIHVIAASEKLEDGYAPDSQLYAQIDVLNEDFGMLPHNINLELLLTAKSSP